jgi:hypothetical protein
MDIMHASACVVQNFFFLSFFFEQVGTENK